MSHVDALSEAIELVGDPSLTLRTLEPAAPASRDADFYADDPAARGEGETVVTSTSAGDRTWSDLVAGRPELADFAQRHWLVPGRRLSAAPAALVATRNDLHRLAYMLDLSYLEHVFDSRWAMRQLLDTAPILVIDHL